MTHCPQLRFSTSSLRSEARTAAESVTDGAPPYDAREVANLLLDIAASEKSYLTHISLYKILYFAHGWYLSETNRPLIKQEFEAWKHGPVVKVVRDEFQYYEKKPITNHAQKLDIFIGKRVPINSTINQNDLVFIKNIYDAYHIYDAWKLSEMTHEPGSPWERLWQSEEPIGRLALRLRNEDIKAHFDSLQRRLLV